MGLSALCGECIEDMERLRQDKGLEAMLGYQEPAAETARQWLDKFHDEELVSGRPQQGAFIPVESASLAGLREPNRQVIWSYIDKMKPGQEVTLVVDAHLVETRCSLTICSSYPKQRRYHTSMLGLSRSGYGLLSSPNLAE